jgi:hypothetical protein
MLDTVLQVVGLTEHGEQSCSFDAGSGALLAGSVGPDHASEPPDRVERLVGGPEAGGCQDR